jgi:predicted helicase
MASTQFRKSIANYLESRRLYASHSVENESSVRQAFLTLLDATSRPFRWTMIPEHPRKVFGGRLIRPDATLQDEYTIERGFYEAKDVHDDLELEIRKKLHAGYPDSNIIFEDNSRAALYQNGVPKLWISLDNEKELAGLLDEFYHHKRPDLDGFEAAIAGFQEAIPKIGESLESKIEAALRPNTPFQRTFDGFLALCRQSLNPNLRPESVREMLVQHLLTERLIRRVFDYDDFVRRNVIASEVENVIDALPRQSFTRRDFLRDLDRYYSAIESTADTLTDFETKQHFLDRVYEKFFQAWSPDTADTHGIVYTPPQIVKYMCSAVAQALEHEFNRPLGSEGTYILDPCTGTGNFIAHLIQNFIPPSSVQRMYASQLFANEVMLMPYYIASLNIEHAYFEKTGERRPFEGLCFVDTLDMAEGPQMGLFTEKNTERVQRQKDAPINVIIGNPPYNVGQKSENDNNKNRSYKVIDQRIKETYSRDSKATSKSKLNDAYVKFFRWASDRIITAGSGILCFVSNNGFVDQHAFDGMRKNLEQDFTLIDHLDLHGNVRKNPKISGTSHNVFGIQVGVGITLAIRKPGAAKQIRYHRVPEMWTKVQKLKFVDRADVAWTGIHGNVGHAWLPAANADEFDSMLPLTGLFTSWSMGVNTNRDAVLYDFQHEDLLARVHGFVSDYSAEVDRYRRAGRPDDIDNFVNYEKIKWSSSLKAHLKCCEDVVVDATKLRPANYRPFTRLWLYYDRTLVHRPAKFTEYYKHYAENTFLVVTGLASEKPFLTLVSEHIPDLHIVGAGSGSQCFPLSHLSDSALELFRKHYDCPTLTKRRIFEYIYGLLHHPGYHERYAEALKKELPRIPLAPDFDAFADAGARLMELHLHYEQQTPYPLQHLEKAPFTWELTGKMKLSKDGRSLHYNDSLALAGIPEQAFEYRLGHRSALEWVIDQYQRKENSNPNRADDPEYIVRLVKQVIAVSLETVAITRALPPFAAQPQ